VARRHDRCSRCNAPCTHFQLYTISTQPTNNLHPPSFASVIRHRTDEERSGVYERLLELEEAAKAAKRGIHSSKEAAAPPRPNDVSLPGNAARAKQYLPFFTRAGRVAAVVEYVLSGHRLKVGGRRA
jgi:hypothetical protein